MRHPDKRSQEGFTIVEYTTVVVILGLLASFAVPRFMVSQEKGRVAEAFSYLTQVEGAQERYREEFGSFATSATKLDIKLKRPQHFGVVNFVSADWKEEWQMTLIRDESASGYGRYMIVFDQDGYSRSRSSIPRNLVPTP